MKKSFLSILIVLALCLTLLPTAALADGPASPVDAAVTFPQPVPGANISQSMQSAAGNAGSGLTLYLTGPSLWQDGKTSKLDENAVYAEGSVYMLQFIFYTQEPITTESNVTCNGNPVTLYSDYDELTGALSAYDGAQDAYMAFVMFSEDGTGDPSMDLTDLYLLTLFACVRVSRPLTTVEVSTADALRAAIETGTDDIVKLTADIDLSEGLTINRSVTLDLNDHVLTITGKDRFITVSGMISKTIELTLTDSAATKTERRFRIDQDGAWVPDENGDQTVSGGVITGGKAGVDPYGALAVYSGVDIQTYGTLTVTGGTVNAPVLNIRGVIAGSGTFNGTVVNEDRITGGTFNGAVANGYNHYTANGEEGLDGRNGGLISGGTFCGKVTNAFSGKIAGGSFYGEVDNRERTYSGYQYRGTLAGGTFYAGHPGTVADGCCTVTYGYGKPGGTYAIQIVQKGETAIRPADPDGKNLTFTGWHTDLSGTNPYDFTRTVTGDMTLYAGWEESVLGIIVTDEKGSEVYVTDKNYMDVLGDGTVSYIRGRFDSTKIPSEYWDNSRLYVTDAAIQKLLAGEEIPGVELSKLTLNGAKLQKIEAFCVPGRMYLWYFPIELNGENRITYPGEEVALDWTQNPVLLLTGDGSLTVDAKGAKTAVAFGDNGRYYQRGGKVTLTAKDYGIAENPYDFTFTDGSLTIQAGNSENPSSGALDGADSFFHHCDITENAAFLLGDSAENPVEFYPPFTRESLFDQYMNALDAETITHEPYYMSLFTRHTVTFETGGGSEVDTQNVAYGEKVQEPVIPTKAGYSFAGWYLGETQFDFDTPVTESITLTAQWTLDSSDSARCRLTFETGGGSALPAVIVPFGTTVELAEYVPARTGYVFTGWYADKALTEKISSVKMAGDRTVYAGWRTSGLPFDDVQPDNWFFGDVQYVYENDLMNGTSANRFGPLASTTRGMVVTVLWRLENSPVVNYAMSFRDVDEGAWYGEAVRWAAANGIVTGYDAETFGANDSVTREQLAAILHRYAEYRDIDVSVGEDTNILSYEDALTISDYAVPAMQWACGAGLIQGADGRLMPRSDASRAQIAAILHRFCENCLK